MVAMDSVLSSPQLNAEGAVDELIHKVADSKIVELRTTYNGSYGASLLIEPMTITYYVVLFVDKRYWRVIKDTDEARADADYKKFVRDTNELARNEIRRTKLEAQKLRLEQMLALSELRARRIRADLDIAHSQQMKSLARQQQARAQITELNAQNKHARTQLLKAQQAVHKLQRQLLDTETISH
ncbi:hypothetical protein WJ62_16700 [Burkholderia diffusa]|nr:hypothetical protein WJ62_16700 [Burkholderia diffusa]